MFVYTVQPVVKPVWQPVVSCKRGITQLWTGFMTSHDPRPSPRSEHKTTIASWWWLQAFTHNVIVTCRLHVNCQKHVTTNFCRNIFTYSIQFYIKRRILNQQPSIMDITKIWALRDKYIKVLHKNNGKHLVCGQDNNKAYLWCSENWLASAVFHWMPFCWTCFRCHDLFRSTEYLHVYGSLPMQFAVFTVYYMK